MISDPKYHVLNLIPVFEMKFGLAYTILDHAWRISDELAMIHTGALLRVIPMVSWLSSPISRRNHFVMNYPWLWYIPTSVNSAETQDI